MLAVLLSCQNNSVKKESSSNTQSTVGHTIMQSLEAMQTQNWLKTRICILRLHFQYTSSYKSSKLVQTWRSAMTTTSNCYFQARSLWIQTQPESRTGMSDVAGGGDVVLSSACSHQTKKSLQHRQSDNGDGVTYLEVQQRHNVVMFQLLRGIHNRRCQQKRAADLWPLTPAGTDKPTLSILISFPSSVWDLARFFLLMHLTATSQSCFCTHTSAHAYFQQDVHCIYI